MNGASSVSGLYRYKLTFNNSFTLSYNTSIGKNVATKTMTVKLIARPFFSYLESAIGIPRSTATLPQEYLNKGGFENKVFRRRMY